MAHFDVHNPAEIAQIGTVRAWAAGGRGVLGDGQIECDGA
jgi:hypothetical protein